MRTAVAFVLSFVASTLAFQVIYPNENAGWTNLGTQSVNWTRVVTDNTTFSIYLDNQQMPGFAPMQLVAQVQVDAGTMSGFTLVNAPSGGWQPGPGYRVNLVKVGDNTTIYAQSGQFNINGSSTSTTASGSSTLVVVPTANAPVESTGTSGSSATDSASVLPTSSSAASLSYPVQTGLLGLFSLLGLALA